MIPSLRERQDKTRQRRRDVDANHTRPFMSRPALRPPRTVHTPTQGIYFEVWYYMLQHMKAPDWHSQHIRYMQLTDPRNNPPAQEKTRMKKSPQQQQRPSLFPTFVVYRVWAAKSGSPWVRNSCVSIFFVFQERGQQLKCHPCVNVRTSMGDKSYIIRTRNKKKQKNRRP